MMLEHLYFFRKWLKSTFSKDVGFHGDYDLAFVFSTGIGSGLAGVGDICSKHSVAIAGGPDFEKAFAARHEVGHALGAPHDDHATGEFSNSEECPDCGEARVMGGNQKHLFSTHSMKRMEAVMYGKILRGTCLR